MGLFDRFKTNKVKLPVRKFDLKLPNGMAVGDYLLLEGDEERRKKKYEVSSKMVIPPSIWKDSLAIGELLYEIKITYVASVIQGWSFKGKCTPRKAMEFVRSVPYLLSSLVYYLPCSVDVVRTKSEYKSLPSNRDSIQDYSVLEQASGFIKYKLDKYGEDMQGEYFLFHKKYSHRYMALNAYLPFEAAREELRDPPRTKDEHEKYFKKEAMVHMAHLMADWSIKKVPSFDNKYNYLSRNESISFKLYEKILTEKDEFQSLI